ncbi:lipoprotein N-acyltransferase Lnb domain-containing protein [Fibrella aquatilis]|uniref:lipoprotein N-acyltransferase Lnb domain-containing protein n=1 Tax=Fibrella aquatilis TaxID=2817059 RepID=UPI001E5A9723|nr:DUF4105 domain-containing protein [Fibrella aquatilis]
MFIVHSSEAQALSPAARVSLITYGPGQDDISSVFGHTEIRISDPMTGFDRDYSYGGFDYRADLFVLKFLRGTLPYFIASHQLNQVAWYYQQNNRSIREQVLNLSASQRQRLLTALETNLLPQNREYRYKFYYDNCATRPRDMIDAAMGDSLVWSPTVKQPTKSYRAWMNDYLGAKPWERLGMNLAIGRPADKVTTGWESMYLPDNVFDQLANAQVRTTDGRLLPLVTQTQTLFEGQRLFKDTLPLVLYPDFVMLVLLVLVALLTWQQWNSNRLGLVTKGRWLDRLLFGFAGIWGWFLFLLWFATDHGVTTWNTTLLWMMPLHIPGVFWATSAKRHPYQAGMYFRITALLLFISLFLAPAPGFADELFIGILLVRALYRSWVRTDSRQLVAM